MRVNTNAMEALLDTHIAIWWFENSPNFSKRASTILADRGNTLYVSAAVGWEIAIKVNVGKFDSAALIGDMAGFLEREGWRELPIKDRARGARGPVAVASP